MQRHEVWRSNTKGKRWKFFATVKRKPGLAQLVWKPGMQDLPLADLPLKKNQGKFFKQKSKRSIEHQKEKITTESR